MLVNFCFGNIELMKNIFTILHYIILSIVALMGLNRYGQWKEQKLYDELHKKYCEIMLDFAKIESFFRGMSACLKFLADLEESEIKIFKSKVSKLDEDYKNVKIGIDTIIVFIEIYFLEKKLYEVIEIGTTLYKLYGEFINFDTRLIKYKSGSVNKQEHKNILKESKDLGNRIEHYQMEEFFYEVMNIKKELRNIIKK